MTLIKSIAGIRGTIGGSPGETLSPLDVVRYAGAFGEILKTKFKNPKVVIGRDARPVSYTHLTLPTTPYV